MNPDLKYVCIKFACIFGGEKIRCRGSGIRKSSTYRDLGCPCMINAVVGEDGNHVKLDTVILEHNHVLCKTLYDSLKKTKRKSQTIKNNKEFGHNNSLLDCKDLQLSNDDISYLVLESELKEKDGSSNNVSNTENETEENVLLVEQSESMQTFFENPKDKFGGNIKVLVVNSENANHEFEGLLKFNEKETESELLEFSSAKGKMLFKKFCCLSQIKIKIKLI